MAYIIQGTEQYTVLGAGTVSSGGTDAPDAGTSEDLTVDVTVAFPVAAASGTPPTGFYFADIAAPSELMLATTAPGGTGSSQSWVVTRGADGTTPVTHTAGYTIQQVLGASSLRALQSPSVDAVTQFGADPTGTDDSTSAIQAAMLSFGTLAGWVAGSGGVAGLPPGSFKTSKPLIIPSGVTLRGAGFGATFIQLATGSNCDIVQWSTYDSSAQASILGVSASDIGNAFYAGIEGLMLEGDAFTTTTAGYHYGINQTTNPLESAASSDPAFDPTPLVRDVHIKACTGDGFFASGRAGGLLERVLSENHNGNGFTPSQDTTLLDCLANANQVCGFYINGGSDTGAGCKSYDHESTTAWVSGTSYTAGNVAIYDSVMYFCIESISDDTTTPNDDATHWTALSATSPQAAGAGYFWDSDSADQSWICDSQDNLTAYWVNTCTGLSLTGTAQGVGQGSSGTTENAALTLEGTSQVNILLSAVGFVDGSGLYIQSSAGDTGGFISIATDGSESAQTSPDSEALDFINALLMYNGPLVTATIAKLFLGTFDTAGEFQLGTSGLPEYTDAAGLTGSVPLTGGAGTVPVTVSNTVTETSIGSLVVPGGDPVAGARYAFTIPGTLSTSATAADNAGTITTRWGSVTGTSIMTLASGVSMPAMGTSIAGAPFLLKGEVDFASGTTCTGWQSFSWLNGTSGTTAASWNQGLAVTATPVTVTTSVAGTLTVDWKWAHAETANVITASTSAFDRLA